jgi:putative oxidoreductase
MTTKLESRLSTFSSPVLSLFRIVFGLLFAVHGASKLFAWPVDSGTGAVPVGTWPYWWAGLIELVLGVLITIGLFTRIAAFIASGHMAVAYFWQHAPNGLHPLENGGEPAVLFCFGFLLLAATGGGSIAVDALRGRGRVAARA